MNRFICLLAFVAFATLLPLTTLSAQTSETEFAKKAQSNWHQWRGPDATGMATGTPPTTWSETENVAWKIELPGEGSSTPIIWDEKLFVIAAVETDRQAEEDAKQHAEAKTKPTGNVFDFMVICLNKDTGKEIWKKVVTSAAPHEGRHSSTTYAAASPMTDGKHLYVSFGSYGIFCLTLDGKDVWDRDLGDMRTRRGWGEAVSPVIADGKIVVMWDQEDQSEIFTLDGSTGKTLWSKKRDEPTTWATPLPVSREGKTQIITAGTNQVRSYDLESGELKWQSKGLTLNAIPCPVLNGDHAICMSGYRGNQAISIDLSDASSESVKIDWQLQRDTPYVASPLLTKGRLYFVKSLNAILSCVDADSGKPIFEVTRLPNMRSIYASPVATENNIYVSSREGGTLVLANQPEFKVIANNKLDGGIDASPAIVGDSIYIRTKTHLYRIKE